jgi:hypothetical protein
MSYVSEDRATALRLAEHLRGYGIAVWLDRDSLLGGDRWAASIEDAIRHGAAFIACFSANSESRDRSHMREEITLAIAELRLRATSSNWFIPVLLDGTSILDDRAIGSGIRLSDVQHVDMSSGWDRGVRGIVASLLQRNSPEERAKLADDLSTARALETLAVAEGSFDEDPFRAFEAVDVLSRVSLARSSEFIDRIASRLSGVASVHDLDEVPNRFGVTHFAERPLALSRYPGYAVWSGRTGAIATAQLRGGGGTILHPSYDYAADVFIDSDARVIAACYVEEATVLAWQRVSANEWQRADRTLLPSWTSLLGALSSTRYGARGGDLMAVRSSFEGTHLINLSTGADEILAIENSYAPAAISPDGSMIVIGLRDEYVVLGYQGGRWVVRNRFAASLPLEAMYAEHGLPNGRIRITPAGGLILTFRGRAAYLHDAITPVTRESFAVIDGAPALSFPGSSSESNPMVTLGRSINGSNFQAVALRTPGRYGPVIALACSGISYDGLQWLETSAQGDAIGVVDERGRVLVIDPANPGPVDSELTSLLVPRGAVTAVANGLMYAAVGSHAVVVAALFAGETKTPAITWIAPPIPKSASPAAVDVDGSHLVIAYRLGTDVARLIYPLTADGRPFSEPLDMQVETFGRRTHGINLSTVMLGHNRAAWQADGSIDVVTLAPGFDLAGRFETPGLDVRRVWDVASDAGIGFVLSFSDDVRVFDLRSGGQVAALTGTGGGAGGDYGDDPGDLRVVDGIVVSSKRSGSIARWRLEDLDPIGRPLLVNTGAHLGRIRPLTEMSRGVVIDSELDGCVVVRDLRAASATAHVFSGMGILLGAVSPTSFATQDLERQVRIWDLSTRCMEQSVRSIVRRSSRIGETR